MIKSLTCTSLLCFLLSSILAQSHYRLRCDVSIKEKKHTGAQELVLGAVYYDSKAGGELYYHIHFPYKEIWKIADNQLLRIRENIVVSRVDFNNKQISSIFELALANALPSFGLGERGFKIDQVEQNEHMVISTWVPTDGSKKSKGKILISTIDRKLSGTLTYDANNSLISKKVYQDYVSVSGVNFPQEVIEVSYHNEGEDYKITNYSNIIIDENSNEDKYHPVIISE